MADMMNQMVSSGAINNRDLAALRDYVTAPGACGQNRSSDTVLLAVTHCNLKAKFMEIRLSMAATVEDVKHKLMTHTGTNPSAMVLHLKDEGGKLMAQLEDGRMLGYYSPYDGCVLHVIDTDPTSLSAGGWLEDVSKVDKYKISDEAYAARENTFAKFKAAKLSEDPEWTLEKEMAKKRGVEYNPPAPKITDDEYGAQEAEGLTVGARCQAQPGDRRGEIAFVGKIPELPAGWWVGVRLDEPMGKNDGTVKGGRRVFECAAPFGMFARPDKVTAGDFPPLDEFDEDSDFGSDDEI